MEAIVLGSELPGGTVIRDYGRGGSRVTVCWGCAEEGVRLGEDL